MEILDQLCIWGISGQLKCAFDRLFAVAEMTPNYENPKKDCILLMAAEGDTESNFAPVRAFYEGLTSHLGWKNIGIVYAGEIWTQVQFETKQSS